MITVTFKLKEPRSKEPTLIVMSVFYGVSKRLVMSTSEKVHPKFWNGNRVRENRELRIARELNMKLDRFENAAKKAAIDIENANDVVTHDKLKDGIKSILNLDKSNRVSFMEYFDSFVKEKKSINASNWKSYNTTFNILKSFFGKRTPEFDDINFSFYDRLMKVMDEKNYSTNYKWTQIKNIKAVMNKATLHKLNESTDYNNFKKISEVSDTIYLSEEDIKKIYELEIEEKYLDNARDLFLVGCCTALRYSDFTQITIDNINDNILSFVTEKTNVKIVIPVHYMLKQILEKHDGKPPRGISNQNLNKYLKIIGERAGINDIIIKVITKGGKKIRKSYFKYELITTHTARRSAATNMYKNGIPSIAIMKITGHQTEKDFMKYIKISSEESARLIANNPFFNK